MILADRLTLLSEKQEVADKLKFSNTKSRMKWRKTKQTLLATLKKQKARLHGMGDAKALDPE